MYNGELREKRDNEFMSVCDAIIKKNKGVYLTVEQITAEALKHKASSFFLTVKRIQNAISSGEIITQGNLTSSTTRRLYNDLYDEYIKLSEKHPDKQKKWYAEQLAQMPTKCFYVEPITARDIYYKTVRKRNKKK